jgi:serine/threonine-protein kinase
MSLDPQDLTGQTLGPYKIGELIGEGGFAWVFDGTRTDDGARVALKVLRPRYTADPRFESRFRNEYEVAASLKHPNIIRILDVGREGGVTYFAMDRYHEQLSDRIDRYGPLAEQAVVEIAKGIAQGLAYAHQAGIIHRDVKAGNILLGNHDRPIITDFGIARAVSGYASATGVDMTIGTPHYIAPEQAQGRPLDGRTDLYALGVTLYKATTGTLPFRSTDWFELARMHVEDPPESPRKKSPDLSSRVERVILKLMAKDPDDRYPSADELVGELEQLEDPSRRTETFGRTSVIRAILDSSPTSRWRNAAAAVLVVVVVALLVVLLTNR